MHIGVANEAWRALQTLKISPAAHQPVTEHHKSSAALMKETKPCTANSPLTALATTTCTCVNTMAKRLERDTGVLC